LKFDLKALKGKYKGDAIEVLHVVGGSLILAAGLNLFIIPLGLYSGGLIGISQLLRLLLSNTVHISKIAGIDLYGIIYLLLNIPLIFWGYKVLGKRFALKTLIAVAVSSLFLSLIPIPQTPIIEDFLTSCILGGIIVGAGSGLILRGRSAGGGLDIIGMVMAKKKPGNSVGRLSIIVNFFVYVICLIVFNVEIAIYSLIFSAVSSIMVDRLHSQNINMSVMIFTKKTGISAAIMEELHRGVTNWDGEGAYTHKTAYVLFTIISKYEVSRLRRIVRSIDPQAFVIFMEGAQVDGNFEKRL
jgi:uncharacterized membrane-anchored protein YitT (DUF2179 family)